jgi:predicted nuclease with TOPRIM domain
MYLNRTLCSVLQEMRKAYDSRNFSYLLGLIEEAQSMGNRMEAAFEDVKDVNRLYEQRKKLHAEVSKLKNEKKELGGKVEDIDPLFE